ncbi:WbqC family protein, partial [Candidatus Gracilibacteria bacterium]|nr:WbqC family protein [Candidatus Gracilibacteria bacterium]
MICSIHQPNYIPYLGLFDKLKASDIFVFYDTAQYTKGDYHNRNTIKGPNGPILLSLPVQVSLGQKITEAKFDARILEKHKKSIQESYRKSAYFAEIHPLIEE